MRHAEKTAKRTAIVDAHVGREGVALCAGFSIRHDIEDARGAFSIVFRARVGDDFNALDGRSRIVFQDERRVGTHHLAGLSVNVNLEARTAVDFDVVFTVNSDHWHLAKHVEQGVGLRFGVFLHGIRNAVDFGFHEASFRSHGGLSQHAFVLLQEERAEIGQFAFGDRHVSAQRLLADAHHFQGVFPRSRGAAYVKAPVFIACCNGNGFSRARTNQSDGDK